MKKSLLAILLFCSLAIFAQEEDKKKKDEHSENEAHDRIVIGYTFDNWIHNVDSLKTKWNSWGFHFYYMYDIPLGKSRFSFAPGVGFSASWVKNNSGLDDSVDSLGTIFRPLKIDYKRNSLVTSYFDIPFELRYRSKPNSKNKSFKLGAGVVAGVQMSNHTKTKTSDTAIVPAGDTKVLKVYRYDDLMKFRFGPTFRIGYGSANLFFYYSVLSLFKNDKGPTVNPFSVGLTVNGL